MYSFKGDPTRKEEPDTLLTEFIGLQRVANPFFVENAGNVRVPGKGESNAIHKPRRCLARHVSSASVIFVVLLSPAARY
jgi:hypothetical protein